MKRLIVNVLAVGTILTGGLRVLQAQTPDGQACCNTIFSDKICCGTHECSSGWFSCSAN
jgi:hypothetical protein